MEAVLDQAIITGMVLAVTLAFAHAGRESASAKPFLIFDVLLTGIALGIWNTTVDGQYRYSFLAEVHIPFLAGVGPLMHWLSLDLSAPESSRPRLSRSIFLLPAGTAAALLLFYFAPAAEKAGYAGRLFDWSDPLLTTWVFSISLVICVAYSGLTVYRLRFVWRIENLRKEPELIVLFLALAFAMTVYLPVAIGLWTGNTIWLKAAVALITPGLMGVVVARIRRPGGSSQTREVIARLKNRRDLGQVIDLGAIRSELSRLMSEEKIYTDDELSLNRLAKMAGVTGHQLSQYLNEYEHQNFNTYINTFRIAAARELLLSDPERSAVSVGYAVGFNNYTTFQKAFRKITGQSPGKFRNQHTSGSAAT